MGAFIVADIEFKTEKDRKKFEKLFKIKKERILVDENSESYGFGAWAVVRNVKLNPVYYLGFMGYSEPKDMLNECKKKKIKIKSFNWIAINDKGSKWEKI
jgi:hypothetical protein